MKKYELEILGRLIDKYESSKSFSGDNKVNQSFSIKLRNDFKEYADDSKINEIKAIDSAINDLAARNWVEVRYGKNGLIESVSLKIEYLELIYHFLKRSPKRDINERLQSLLGRYCHYNEYLEAYCSKQITRLKENKNVEHFNGNFDDFENVLKALSQIAGVEQETFQRDYSIRIFGDSKIFEKIRSVVVAILYEYGDFPEKDTILEDLNIVKNPGHIYFKGNGSLKIGDQIINIGKINGDIAISSLALKDIDDIHVFGDKVLTIENLTTFNSYVPDNELVIYLGGYHNSARRQFLKMLYSCNPDKEYYHYGDIDAGGFYILLHLRNKTGISFKPFNMDAETLKANMKYTKKLSDNDKKRLSNLLGNEFDEVIQYMLANDCKLEQEALD